MGQVVEILYFFVGDVGLVEKLLEGLDLLGQLYKHIWVLLACSVVGIAPN